MSRVEILKKLQAWLGLAAIFLTGAYTAALETSEASSSTVQPTAVSACSYSTFACEQLTSNLYPTLLPSPLNSETPNHGQSAYVALLAKYTYTHEPPFTTTASPTPIPSNELVCPSQLPARPLHDNTELKFPARIGWGVTASAWQIEDGLQVEALICRIEIGTWICNPSSTESMFAPHLMLEGAITTRSGDPGGPKGGAFDAVRPNLRLLTEASSVLIGRGSDLEEGDQMALAAVNMSEKDMERSLSWGVSGKRCMESRSTKKSSRPR
ncbi:beta-glucosidase A [Colletotrichum orchidophilum]|uniref:Beta-glucosidase A n=1 Tax=Colletotrichum orchidophilum TaxID=1209926 RepID=A0A1G4BAJ3_9PEZI|nr:beta-glucosidase A [Colletotrichum orchidophilum]OHE98424.1 beta-glucosidase A [Colletotrichum orchidophilum]